MSDTLQDFARECKGVLSADPGPTGRLEVSNLLKKVLNDTNFLETYLGKETPERQVLYEDTELGFVILAHRYAGASESKPHDHGPSWAIYGQARGETEMTEWELVEAATSTTPGKVRKTGTTILKQGMAFVYNEGELHSPHRFGPTSLIRIEGINLEGVQRLAYEPVEQGAEAQTYSNFNRDRNGTKT